MQLPGYLRGQALQEWHLLPRSEQQSYPAAIEALRTRLNPGSKTVAAQEFRHSLQKSGESVSDFIRRLEKKYQIAYGRDDLNTAARDALLYGQLYEGLRYEIMLSPAVSGSQGYQELATAAEAEERRLAALKQRQRYSKPPGNDNSTSPPPLTPTGNQSTSRNSGKNAPSGPSLGKDTGCVTIVERLGTLLQSAPRLSERVLVHQSSQPAPKKSTVVGNSREASN